MPQRQQHEQSYDLNRPKGAIRPSGFSTPAKLAAARKYYDREHEGHSYVYSQSPYRAHPLRLSADLRWGNNPTICCWQRKRIATALGLSATLAWRENEFLQLQSSVPRCIAHFLARA
jgi:hypothetical protein